MVLICEVVEFFLKPILNKYKQSYNLRMTLSVIFTLLKYSTPYFH
jgi:hypothetical protein